LISDINYINAKPYLKNGGFDILRYWKNGGFDWYWYWKNGDFKL